MAWLPYINMAIFWLAVWLLLWNLYIVVFNRGVPNIRTAPAIRKKIIQLLKEDAKRHTAAPYKVIDIGSGNGQFTREIARALPHARVTGIEISRQSYWWSMCIKRLFRLHNLDYKRVDFFTYDVSDVDAVVMFFYRLHRVAQKLRRELKPGTLVTSNKFKLGDGWVPHDVIDVKTLYPFQKKLYVYYKPEA
ncbi:MAG: class I SAM-dependent methyltransferase [Micavibrio sp.]|nr:class I SAM-dependent methyltransferase [Micavibrio sp.]